MQASGAHGRFDVSRVLFFAFIAGFLIQHLVSEGLDRLLTDALAIRAQDLNSQ